jgi:hypothetical protein
MYCSGKKTAKSLPLLRFFHKTVFSLFLQSFPELPLNVQFPTFPTKPQHSVLSPLLSFLNMGHVYLEVGCEVACKVCHPTAC